MNELEAWLWRHFALRLSIRDGDVLLTRREDGDGELVGVCLGATRKGVGHLAFVGVSRPRHGIGRSLVEELAQRLGPLTTRFCDVSAFPGVPEEAAGFFTRLGFTAGGRECTMRAPLGGFLGRGDVEPVDAARLPLLRQLISAEFESSWASMLDEKLAHGAPHEVLVTGAVSGFVIVTAAQPRCFFGPMGVAAGLRRQGLGRTLALSALARLQASGAPEVELWTDPDSFLGRSFYPSLGFQSVRIWHNYSR